MVSHCVRSLAAFQLSPLSKSQKQKFCFHLSHQKLCPHLNHQSGFSRFILGILVWILSGNGGFDSHCQHRSISILERLGKISKLVLKEVYSGYVKLGYVYETSYVPYIERGETERVLIWSGLGYISVRFNAVE